MTLSYNRGLFDRFLRILGLGQEPPSIEALAELTRAYLIRIPFENISKLYYRNTLKSTDLPGLERFLDGVEQYHFGGTCYTNNYYLHLLLCHLGYEAKLCGADMSRPDVHLVNIVRVEGREFLVDGGYAAPFLKPMPLDLDREYAFELGDDRFVLSPRDSRGRSQLQLVRNGQSRHGYSVNPRPRRIEEFAEVIAHSYTDAATFMNALLLVRFFDNRALVIHNLEIRESEGSSVTVKPIKDREALPATIEEYFGIPRRISADALSTLGEFRNAWN